MSRRRPHALARFFPLALVALVSCSEQPAATDPTSATGPLLGASACPPPADLALLIERIESLRDEVDALERASTLNSGQARALRRHLDNAARQLARGEFCAVYDQLQAFRDQLADFAVDGGLSDRDLFELRLQSRLALGGGAPMQPGVEEHAPGVTGEIRTVQYGGEVVTYEVIDGLALLNSDMILGFADEFEAAAASGGASQSDGPESTAPCFNSEISCARWDDGVIGFDFFPDWGVNTEYMIGQVLLAINHWREVTGMEFERRTSGQRIIFRNGSGCSSWVGRNPFAIFDPQYVFLGFEPGEVNCSGVGVIVHEIGHAVGLFHEQSRNDRHDFVAIDFTAIEGGKELNFFVCGLLCRNVGEYDFGSIMHYPCTLFTKTPGRPTLLPIVEGVTCDEIGRRDDLSERDIAGAYTLYEPRFEIVGASSGDVGDRFDLSFQFETEPVADEYMRWFVSGIGPVAEGPTFSTADVPLANGDHRVTAEIFIGGVLIGTPRIIDLTIDNAPPTVDLGPDREVPLWVPFTVTAEVTDREDGSCAPTVCTYQWSPEPSSPQAGTVEYDYFTLDEEITISVTVTDKAGATASDEVVISIVNVPPEPIIESPVTGSRFPVGSVVPLSGYATDPNEGQLSCRTHSLLFTSSDASDLIDVPEAFGPCSGTIQFGDPGVRTIRLDAWDHQFTNVSTSVIVEVYDCDASGCPPVVSLSFTTPNELDGSAYDPPFTGLGYRIDTELQVVAAISDADGPPPGTVSYEWRVRPPCFGCEAFVVDSGSLLAPNNAFLNWTPSSDPRVTSYWPSCTTIALPFVLSLHATDLNGNTQVVSRTVHLACDLI